MKAFLIIFMVLAASCAHYSKQEKIESDPLREKYNNYVKMYLQKYPNYIAHEEDGDCLVFAGLIGTVDDIPIDITRFKFDKGLFLRRIITLPDIYEELWENGERKSKSQCSRDTYLSVLMYLWYSKHLPQETRLALAQEIWERGIENDWVMCKGEVTRTKFSKSLIGTLAHLIFRLGGEAHKEKDSSLYTFAISGFETGYQRHLGANHALLRADLTGRMPKGIFAAIAQYRRSQPHNPLYQYVYHKFKDFDQTETLDILLTSQHWPDDRLPNSMDHCEKWLIQRDMGKDWEPCLRHQGGDYFVNWKIDVFDEVDGESIVEHSGGDWLYVADKLLKSKKKK